MSKVEEMILASNTWREIHAQPEIWRSWAGNVDFSSLRAWVDDQGVEEVWFCGAGTSAYIGDIIASGLTNRNIRFRSVPSTDIVSSPHAFFPNSQRLLIVNFGRSGNSSETIGTLKVLEALAPETAMLNITCNPHGMLARTEQGRTIVLPEACHDAGFAMTSSFTTMVLTALAIFDRDTAPPEQMRTLAGLADRSLPVLSAKLSSIPRPERIVFVGSGPLTFVARESALKVMELSAGQIPALWDSTLGFRHGPKSFVTENTMIFVLLNSESPASEYDHDLVGELKEQYPDASIFTVGEGGDLDLGSSGSSLWNSVLSVLPAQIASVLWSAQLGLNIDDPFVGQSTLSRVVSGVRLHPVEVV